VFVPAAFRQVEVAVAQPVRGVAGILNSRV